MSRLSSKKSAVATALLATVFVGSAGAAQLTVVDPSFEAYTGTSWGNTIAPWFGGWLDVWSTTPYSLDIPAHDGNVVASGGMSQILSSTFEEGVTYSLSAYFTPRDPNWGQGPLGFFSTSAAAGSDPGAVVAADLMPGYVFAADYAQDAAPFGQWTLYTATYTATQADAGRQIGIHLGHAYWDSVSVTSQAAPVPEPETYAMMLLGLGALGWAARRRRDQGR